MGCRKLEKVHLTDEPSPEELAIIDHIGKILAEEYVKLLGTEQTEKEQNEGSDLCEVLEREPERAEHR